MSPKSLVCFTDGSALNNNKDAPAGWAFYIPKLKQLRYDSMIGTNNQAELEAIRQLLLHLNSFKDELFSNILIYSDSEYSINAITGKNNVRANAEVIKEIQNLRNSLKKKVGFKHVDAHTGKQDFVSRCNDIVDKAAVRAAKKIKNKQREETKLQKEIEKLKSEIKKLKIEIEKFENKTKK